MEVTALCIRLLINVAVLLPAQVQHSYSHRAEATFPRIVPSRLQFFEYEPFSVNCKDFFHDLTKWTVMRNIKGTNTTCKDESETRGTCSITAAFSMDSGEYWCEVDGKKSNKVNIIVTEGSVILDSPALPVTEGDNVTLRCRSKETFNIEADFYKNGVLLWRSSTVEMTICSVSKSDEGLYQCKISGIGESAQSWLAVRGSVILESPALPVMEGDNVTLRCRNKTTSNFPAVFYKDGLLIRNSSTGEMIIHNVSKSDEGLYKCTSGDGESAESWLAVRDSHPSHDCSPHGFIVLRIFGTILLFALGLAMVLHFKKERDFNLFDIFLPCFRFSMNRSQTAESPV